MQTSAMLVRIRPWGSARRLEGRPDCEVRGVVWLRGSGSIRIGRGVRFLADRAPIELFAHRGASLQVDDDVVIEGGVSIEATLSIHVGPRVSIGSFCKLMDNDFHATTGDRTARTQGLPVIVGEDVVLGPRAILLRGAEVGPRAKLPPGAVVSFRVPAGRATDVARRSPR
jgi:acetyltransferase-like isoleucine patch superfamily enzyme